MDGYRKDPESPGRLQIAANPLFRGKKRSNKGLAVSPNSAAKESLDLATAHRSSSFIMDENMGQTSTDNASLKVMSQQRSPLPVECMAIERSSDSEPEGDFATSSDADTDMDTMSPSTSPAQADFNTSFKAVSEGKSHSGSASGISDVTRINIIATSIGGLQAGGALPLQGLPQSLGGLQVKTEPDSGNVTPRQNSENLSLTPWRNRMTPLAGSPSGSVISLSASEDNFSWEANGLKAPAACIADTTNELSWLKPSKDVDIVNEAVQKLQADGSALPDANSDLLDRLRGPEEEGFGSPIQQDPAQANMRRNSIGQTWSIAAGGPPGSQSGSHFSQKQHALDDGQKQPLAPTKAPPVIPPTLQQSSAKKSTSLTVYFLVFLLLASVSVGIWTTVYPEQGREAFKVGRTAIEKLRYDILDPLSRSSAHLLHVNEAAEEARQSAYFMNPLKLRDVDWQTVFRWMVPERSDLARPDNVDSIAKDSGIVQDASEEASASEPSSKMGYASTPLVTEVLSSSRAPAEAINGTFHDPAEELPVEVQQLEDSVPLSVDDSANSTSRAEAQQGQEEQEAGSTDISESSAPDEGNNAVLDKSDEAQMTVTAVDEAGVHLKTAELARNNEHDSHTGELAEQNLEPLDEQPQELSDNIEDGGSSHSQISLSIKDRSLQAYQRAHQAVLAHVGIVASIAVLAASSFILYLLLPLLQGAYEEQSTVINDGEDLAHDQSPGDEPVTVGRRRKTSPRKPSQKSSSALKQTPSKGDVEESEFEFRPSRLKTAAFADEMQEEHEEPEPRAKPTRKRGKKEVTETPEPVTSHRMTRRQPTRTAKTASKYY